MMNQFNFDEIIARRGTGSLKWDRNAALEPFWVADMDFKSPPCLIEALQERLNHGIYGYAIPHAGLTEAFIDYAKSRLGVEVKEEWLCPLGGLVPALSIAAQAYAQEGESLMTTTPIYTPFLKVGRDAQLETITVNHTYNSSLSRWEMDWEAMEKNVQANTRLFLLSNPQNPLGRAFSKEEVIKLAEFCERHDLILIADEIHCDLILDEAATPHFSGLNLPENLRDRTVTLLSPSKTYNMAGIGFAYAVIPNTKLRNKFVLAKGCTQPEINCFAYYAAEAAYRGGESWRQELLAYLRGNRDLLIETVNTQLPQIKIPTIEATYLAWLDFSATGFEKPAELLEKQGVFTAPGAWYGQEPALRINYACPRSKLLGLLDKLTATFGP